MGDEEISGEGDGRTCEDTGGLGWGEGVGEAGEFGAFVVGEERAGGIWTRQGDRRGRGEVGEGRIIH